PDDFSDKMAADPQNSELTTTTIETTGNTSMDIKNIFKMLSTITTSIIKIEGAMQDLSKTTSDLIGRLGILEQRTSDLEDGNHEARQDIIDLKAQMKELFAKIDDQENRARQNNICILGFPEGIEAHNPSHFLEKELPTLLNLPSEMHLEFERGHRSLGPKPKEGQHPRALIAKLLHFPIKEQILKAARESSPLEWNGHKIMVFQDLSRDLQDRRRQFNPVKRILIQRGIKYGLFYPATLRFTWKKTDYSFTTSDEALKTLNKLELQLDYKKGL
uniref:L1 transposable element RRM domain-containing protein n=1 Tax=Latimeria chalumnae TaxID=7897 RepID=H3A4T9_LATCH